MRALTPELVNPLPVGERLPGVLLTDEVVRQFCAAMDDVLTPVVLTLDCLPAYFDPLTTPHDMVEWLADWLGVVLDPRQSIAQQRHLLRKTAKLLRWRGTVRGLRDAVVFATGVVPEIIETGATEWSERPGTELPGRPGNEVIVRLRVDDPRSISVRRLRQTVAAVIPAHIRYEVDIVAAA
jgi:phage tail-like protein